MKLTRRKSRATSAMVWIGLFVIVMLPGCNPPADKPNDKPAAEATEPATDELPEAPAAESGIGTASEPATKETAVEAEIVPGKAPEAPAIEAVTEPAAGTTSKPVAEEIAGAVSIDDKVSTYAPAADLAGQVTYYVGRLENAVATEEEYGESKDKISRDANTLAVIALALGMHDEDNLHKAAAGALVKAAQQVATATDYATAKAAVDAVKAAAASQEASEGELKWTKVANLHALMMQVPMINTKLKRYVKGVRLQSKAAETTGYSAVIAAIAQGSIANADETQKPDEVGQWIAFSLATRNAAAEVNAAIHQGNADATAAAMAQLEESCAACHAVFHQEGVE